MSIQSSSLISDGGDLGIFVSEGMVVVEDEGASLQNFIVGELKEAERIFECGYIM